jgi:RHS repeat-associated protein
MLPTESASRTFPLPHMRESRATHRGALDAARKMRSRNYYDSETGTHYNYFRDYDPTIGRYVQSDPIGLDGGLNTYAYVYDGPLQFADTDGLRPTMGTEPDPGYRWRPEPGDKQRGEVDGGCLVICLAIKMAVGTAVANDFEKLGPLMRDRSLGFGSRGTRLMIGRGGAAIGVGMRAMGKTPPGVLIGLGMSMEFCDSYCQKPQVCPVPFVSQLNNSFQGFPPLPHSRP